MTITTLLAQATAGFDVEQATRVYLNLLQGPARAKSDAYFEGGYWLILWDAVVAVAVSVAILATGWSARFRDWAERRTKRNWLQPALYAIPYTIVSTLLALPWAIYEGFVRERQYGLMNLGLGGWLGDQGKALLIGIVMSAILFTAVFAVIRRFPRGWWVLGTGVFALFIGFGALIAPVFVAPLFNTYTEMPAGPLRTRIEALAADSHIPAQHIYVSDASRQSKRISANVSGLGPTVRITLNDNLLRRTAPDEVAAVMGHEMGHYVLGHVYRLIGLFSLAILLNFLFVSRAAPALIRGFPGWRVRDVADPAAAPVLLGLASIGMLVLTPANSTIVRAGEQEADTYGLDHARQPDAFALVAMRLSEYRKIAPGPVEEFLFFDHPSGATRVRHSMQWKRDHVPGATMVVPDARALTAEPLASGAGER